MREHLYRGKAINRDPNWTYRTDYKNGDWVFGLLSKLDKYGAEMTNEDGVSGIDVDPETICEFVGLTDKNGKNIYEGDIVKIDGKYMRYVVYSGEHTAFCAMRYIDKQQSEFTGTLGDGYDNYKRQYEVVGNIYDNPELLEGQ